MFFIIVPRRLAEGKRINIYVQFYICCLLNENKLKPNDLQLWFKEKQLFAQKAT